MAAVAAAAVVLPVDLLDVGVGVDVGLDRLDRIWQHCRMRGVRLHACQAVPLR